MKTAVSLSFGLGLLIVGAYFAMNVLTVSTTGAIQQGVAATWSVAAINAFGFAGLLLANAK